MPGAFVGRAAIVTGAGRGIGREIAIGLADAGARVALVARTRTELDEVADTIARRGGNAATIPADLADYKDASAAVSVLISASASRSTTTRRWWPRVGPRARAIAAAEIQAALAVNVGAVVILSSLVLPGMLTAGWGRIVNISSGIAEHPAAMIGGNVYAASKAALS